MSSKLSPSVAGCSDENNKPHLQWTICSIWRLLKNQVISHSFSI